MGTWFDAAFQLRMMFMNSKGFNSLPKSERLALMRAQKELLSSITARRNELKLTQESLAHACNVSLPTIKAIESGKRIPSISMLLRMFNRIGLKVTVSKI